MVCWCPNNCKRLDKFLGVCFDRPLLSENGFCYMGRIVIAKLEADCMCNGQHLDGECHILRYRCYEGCNSQGKLDSSNGFNATCRI